MSRQISPHLHQHTFRQRLIQCRIKIQQSFDIPFRAIILILLLIPYLQVLKYPIDIYIGFWLGTANKENITWLNSSNSAGQVETGTQKQPNTIFGYLNIAQYTKQVSILVAICLGFVYLALYVVILLWYKIQRLRPLLVFYKILKIVYTSFFYIFMVSQLCKSVRDFKWLSQQQALNTINILGIVCLLLFSALIIFQNWLDFNFIVIPGKAILLKYSNWTTPCLLLYILVNQLTLSITIPPQSYSLSTPITVQTLTPQLIIMNILFGLITLICILKKQHQNQSDLTCLAQKIIVLANILSIVMVDVMILLPFWMDISLWICFWIVGALAIWWYQMFNIEYELENINKWNNSSLMIQYTQKLILLLQREKDDCYYRVLLLGYSQIHRQKCDYQECPLFAQTGSLQLQIQQLIKKIYGQGCKISPVSQDLLLQYSLFLYYFNNKQKSLKILLSINIEQLTFQKFYKYMKLKQKVYGQISQLPDQRFLDLLSQMHVKQHQKDIIKKFEESALANLEFWSVLNQDYPDFNKLYELGRLRVQISENIHRLYSKICKIAHSQRVTHLYIHYLRDIQNDQFMYDEIFQEIDQKKHLSDKIVIEDWVNDSRAILIVSQEQQNKQKIIDVNTTCATMLGYEKYQLITRKIQHIFPERLSEQISRFLNPQTQKVPLKYQQTSCKYPDIFYIGHSNGYSMRVRRSIQNYNSIQTGMSLIIVLEHQFQINSCSLLFENIEPANNLKKSYVPSKVEKIQKQSYLMESNQIYISKKMQQSKYECTSKALKLISMSSSCIQFLGIQLKLVELGMSLTDIFRMPINTMQKQRIVSTLPELIFLDRLESSTDRKICPKILQQHFSVHIQRFKQLISIRFNMNYTNNKIAYHYNANNNSKSNYQNEVLQTESKKQEQIQQSQNDTIPEKCNFQFHIADCFNTFTYLGDQAGRGAFSPLDTLFSLSLKDREQDEYHRNINYGLNISTLRLHQNYIKVIEDQGSDNGEQNSSTTSTRNNLIENGEDFEKLGKKDQQNIFESHQTYCDFFDKNQLKSKIRICSLLCCLLTVGIYLMLYLVFRQDFNKSIVNYNRIINKNLLIEQLSTARYLLIETELVLLTHRQALMQGLLLEFMFNVKQKIQLYLQSYTEPFNINVVIAPGTPSQYRQFLSDQFYLSYSGYFDSLYTSIISRQNELKFIENLSVLKQYDYWYIKTNGDITKQLLVENSKDFASEKVQQAKNVITKNLFFLIGGLFIQIVLSFIIVFQIYKINKQKIAILQIFLQSNEKIIQSFSAKTQGFLMTLHVEEASDNIDNFEQDIKNKGYFSNAFGKKKRFKSTEFKKTSYIVILVMWLVSVAFHFQIFFMNNDSFLFVSKSMEYAYTASRYGDVIFSGVASMSDQIIKKQHGLMNKLSQSVNNFTFNILQYEKQFLQSHYQSFGTLQEYHQYFSDVFLYDICDGKVKIPEACYNELSTDGASIIVTDLTISLQLFEKYRISSDENSTSIFQYNYFKNLLIIKNSHQAIKNKSIQMWAQLQINFDQMLLQTLLIWTFILVTLALMFQIYLSKVVMKDLQNMQEMLKFLPISFAMQSPRMNNYISLILQQSSF